MTNSHPSLAYREAAVRGADPVQLVIMLYDIVLADLQRAMAAFDDGDVERRTNELKHALAAVEQLQGTLEMERGGQAAQQLDRFYDFARAQILEAQLRQSPERLARLAGAFSSVRQAWEELRSRTMEPAAVIVPTAPVASSAMASWTV